jgi:hypothetical protein
MASLRDVLNHIGVPVRIERGNQVVGEVLGTARAGVVLLEPKVEPRPGDRAVLVGTGQAFRVQSVHAETVGGRVDHYRLVVDPTADPAHRG